MFGAARYVFAALLMVNLVIVPSIVASGQTLENSVPLPLSRPQYSPPVERGGVLTNPQNDANRVRDNDNCLEQLQAIADAQPAGQPETSDSACVIENPASLQVIHHPFGSAQMPGDMLNRCGFALEFSRWVADVVNPLAMQHLGGALTVVHSGKGYVCRRRNNLPTGKLSEHAFGNAIDIIGFELDNGAVFNVKEASKLRPFEARFLKALRSTACGYFTTVLGPGTNPAHATHLHVDLGRHGKSGNYRICE